MIWFTNGWFWAAVVIVVAGAIYLPSWFWLYLGITLAIVAGVGVALSAYGWWLWRREVKQVERELNQQEKP